MHAVVTPYIKKSNVEPKVDHPIHVHTLKPIKLIKVYYFGMT